MSEKIKEIMNEEMVHAVDMADELRRWLFNVTGYNVNSVNLDEFEELVKQFRYHVTNTQCLLSIQQIIKD